MRGVFSRMDGEGGVRGGLSWREEGARVWSSGATAFEEGEEEGPSTGQREWLARSTCYSSVRMSGSPCRSLSIPPLPLPPCRIHSPSLPRAALARQPNLYAHATPCEWEPAPGATCARSGIPSSSSVGTVARQNPMLEQRRPNLALTSDPAPPPSSRPSVLSLLDTLVVRTTVHPRTLLWASDSQPRQRRRRTREGLISAPTMITGRRDVPSDHHECRSQTQKVKS